MHSSRWYPLILSVFVTTLIISNIIAVKLVSILGTTLPAAVILFPIAYIFGDILTEVYGYSRARQAIWIGFGCNLLSVLAIWIAGVLPADQNWRLGTYPDVVSASQAYQAILGYTPRLLLASFIAYLFGEFLNAFVLAKLKVATRGRMLWIRTISSTLLGQGVDSMVFITLAFWGTIPASVIGNAIVNQWLFKSVYEALATPFTYMIVNFLKRAENEDYYDHETNFNPIRF